MTPAPTETPTITPTPSVTPTRYPPTWTPTALPTATPTRTPTPLPALDAAVEKDMFILQSQVSDVRELPIDANVPAALLSRENFQSALTAIVNVPGLLPQLQDQSRVLATLGLVPSGTDLTRYTLNSFADNLGGFYLPKYKTLYVVGRKMGSVEKQAYALGPAIQRFWCCWAMFVALSPFLVSVFVCSEHDGRAIYSTSCIMRWWGQSR